MVRVKISDLKNQLSRYLHAVRRGEIVEILDRDLPVARMYPIDHSAASTGGGRHVESDQRFFAEQYRLGILKKGTGKIPSELFKETPPGKPGVLAALIAERREGR